MKRTSIFTATLLTKDPNKLLDEIDSLYVNNKKLEEEKSKLVIRVGELETDKKKLEDQIHKLNEELTIKAIEIKESQAENVSLQRGSIMKKNITELTESIQQISDYERIINEKNSEIENLRRTSLADSKSYVTQIHTLEKTVMKLEEENKTIGELQKKITELKAKNKELSKLKEENKELNEIKSKNNELKIQVFNLENQLQDAVKLSEEKEKVIKALEAKLITKKAKAKQRKEETIKLKNKLSEQIDKTEEYRQMSQGILMSKLTQEEEKDFKIKSGSGVSLGEIFTADTKDEKDEKTLRLEQTLDENAKMKEQLTKYENQLLLLNSKNFESKELDEKVQKLEQKIKEQEEMINSKENEINKIKNENLQKINDKDKELLEKEKMIESINKENEKLINNSNDEKIKKNELLNKEIDNFKMSTSNFFVWLLRAGE